MNDSASLSVIKTHPDVGRLPEKLSEVTEKLARALLIF